jgi:hypothetical protein
MPAPLPLWLLLPPVLALGGGAVRVLVVSDDPALGKAVVRSAAQHLAGPIVLGPAGTPTPVGALRLQVQRAGADRLQLSLSRGGVRVRRTLPIRGQPRAFDLAEAVAIALPALRTQLEQQALRQPVSVQPPAPPPPAQAQEASVVALVVEPVPPPAKEPAPVGAPAPVAAPAAEAAPPPPALETAPPRVVPPNLAPAPASAPYGPERPRAQAWRWQLGLGVGLSALGLAAVSLGAASLALDGRCADAAVPCEYRYDGRVAGAAELAVGGAAALAGAGLVISAAIAARREARPARALLVPGAVGSGLGLSLTGAF